MFLYNIKILKNPIKPQVKIILLIGINTNLMTYPTTPITANPIAQAVAIFINSKIQINKMLKQFNITFLIRFLTFNDELFALYCELY